MVNERGKINRLYKIVMADMYEGHSLVLKC